MNFTSMQEGQSEVILPKQYRHISALIRAIDVQFIWIDSLCIFQDPPEDVRPEASTTAEVYTTRYVHLVLAGPPRSSDVYSLEMRKH